jgi:hypothetical protein
LQTISLFRRAVRCGGPYRTAIPPEQEGLFEQWARRFPLREQVADNDKRRRGRGWNPPPPVKCDGLEALLGRVELVPQEVWATACDTLAGQVPDEHLAHLRRCEVQEDLTGLVPTLTLWPPGDPAAGAALSTHMEAIRAVLAAQGIWHVLDVEMPLDPLSLLDEQA